MHCEHLSAEAYAKKGPPLPQGDFDPVNPPADVVVGIVGAHRTTEDQSARVIIERFRESVAKTRAANVQTVSQRSQHIADAAGRRIFLVQDDQKRTRPLATWSCRKI